MKFILKETLVFCVVMLNSILSFTQEPTHHLTTKITTMETVAEKNKQAILNLYENILNNRKWEQLETVISNDYSNNQGSNGVAGFQKQIQALIQSFPDGQWTLADIVAEGNKVMVKQTMKGTQSGAFQHIPPSNKAVTVNGIGMYEFKEGKIIHSDIQTDRLGFLQQLGVIPANPQAATTDHDSELYFIDKFLIPGNAMAEFTKQMNYNRNFIKGLDGFIKDEIFEQTDATGNVILITIATWKGKAYLDKAKAMIQAAYQKINFDAATFYKRLNIKMERGIYCFYKE